MANADTARLIASLELQDKLSPTVNKVVGSVDRLEKATNRATTGTQRIARGMLDLNKATGRTQQSLGKFSQNIQRGVVIGAAAVGAGFLSVVRAAADYESAFAGVRKTVSATEGQLQELSGQFRQLSKEIPISASELARLGEAGGALGVPTAQLKEFVRVTALLGVTTNLTSDEAANSLGILGNVLHLTGAEYSKFASSLVALGNAGASTEADIVAIAQRAGAAGHLVGVSTQQILGFASATASLGIEAEAGGTAIQKFFIDSAKAVGTGGKKLETFAKVAGTTTKAFAASFKKDAGGALEDFLAGLGKLPQSKQLQALKDLGFTDARITRTLLGLANNTKLVADQMGVANKAYAENTALTKEAEQRFNTFDSQLTITKNVLQDMAITIGSKLLPKITPLLQKLNSFVGANQGKIAEFGDKLATGFEKFAAALQKVDWTPFINGLRISSDIAKKAIDLFMGLPAEVKAAAIGAFAVNKLTGGLPTSIAKDVGGVALHALASTRGSSPRNPVWVQSVGGLPGVPPEGGGGIGGTIKSVLGFLGTAALGIAIEKGVADGIQSQTHAFGPMSFDELQKTAAERTAAGWVNGKPPPEPKTGGLSMGDRDLIAATRKAGEKAALDARRVEAAENRTGTLIGANGRLVSQTIAKQISALGIKFGRDLHALRAATKPVDIAKFARAIAADVTKGAGSLSGTKGVLKDLRVKLAETHDPKLAAILRAAIGRVQAKLPGRELAAKSLSALAGMLSDGKITKAETRRIAGIERDLKDHGLPHAAGEIGRRVDAAKAKIAAAAKATTAAVDRKDLTVTVPVNVQNTAYFNGRIVNSNLTRYTQRRKGGGFID